MVGWQQLCGASDCRSILYKTGLVKEYKPRLWPKGEHTYKNPILGEAQKLLKLTQLMPSRFVLQILKIGSFLILALPTEVTVAAGRSLKNSALLKAKDCYPEVRHAVIASVSNQYAGYLTTRKEYNEQSYEGASNLYGVNTLHYLEYQFVQMIQKMHCHETEFRPAQWKIHPLWEKQHFPEPAHFITGERVITGQPEVYFDRIVMEWEDYDNGLLPLDKELVKVQFFNSLSQWEDLYRDDLPVSDQGTRLEIRYLGSSTKQGLGRWRATWWTKNQVSLHLFRFLIQPRGKFNALVSDTFQFSDIHTGKQRIPCKEFLKQVHI